MWKYDYLDGAWTHVNLGQNVLDGYDIVLLGKKVLVLSLNMTKCGYKKNASLAEIK